MGGGRKGKKEVSWKREEERSERVKEKGKREERSGEEISLSPL